MKNNRCIVEENKKIIASAYKFYLEFLNFWHPNGGKYST